MPSLHGIVIKLPGSVVGPLDSISDWPTYITCKQTVCDEMRLSEHDL